MTEETTTDASTAVVDQTPALAEREPRALVPFEAGGALDAMIPRTPEEYARMAKLLIDANCVPASYAPRDASPQQVRAGLIIGLMKSVEIGVPPITGLNGIMIVNNRPSVWGDLAVALVQRNGQLANQQVMQIGPEPAPRTPLDQWDDAYGFRVSYWRKGQASAYVGEFTVADARRAGLWENTRKQPWIFYPKDMLFNRARAKALRAGFADALHGMGIVEEERDVAPEIEHKPNTAALLSDEPDEASEYEEVETESGGTAQQNEGRDNG
jgi:hypothetical protein